MRSSSASNPTAFRFTSSPWDSKMLSCCPGVTNALRKSSSVLLPFHHRSAEMSAPLKHKYGISKDQSSTLWGRTFYITGRVWSSRHDCLLKPQPFAAAFTTYFMMSVCHNFQLLFIDQSRCSVFQLTGSDGVIIVFLIESWKSVQM